VNSAFRMKKITPRTPVMSSGWSKTSEKTSRKILKKPDTKYKPLGDDRDSFRWSRTGTTTELSSLEKIARGEED
jgi:hypothetical protein